MWILDIINFKGPSVAQLKFELLRACRRLKYRQYATKILLLKMGLKAILLSSSKTSDF